MLERKEPCKYCTCWTTTWCPRGHQRASETFSLSITKPTRPRHEVLPEACGHLSVLKGAPFQSRLLTRLLNTAGNLKTSQAILNPETPRRGDTRCHESLPWPTSRQSWCWIHTIPLAWFIFQIPAMHWAAKETPMQLEITLKITT